VHEGDEPDVLADLCHADALSGEGVTEIHSLSLETNSAAVRNGDGRVVRRIGQLLEPAVDRRGVDVEVQTTSISMPMTGSNSSSLSTTCLAAGARSYRHKFAQEVIELHDSL
jgi:hypothetical protein